MTLFDRLDELADYVAQRVFLILIVFLILGMIYRHRDRLAYYFKRSPKYASRERARGIVFGNFGNGVLTSPAYHEGHVFVQGGTGSGKTQAVVIPTINSFIREVKKRWWQKLLSNPEKEKKEDETGHCFAIDISGDIIKNVSGKKLVYNVTSPKTKPYNVFYMADIEKTFAKTNERLEELALLLMPEDSQMNDTSRFFNTEGRKILTSALIAFYHTGKDFVEICDIIYKNSWMDLFKKIDECKIELATSLLNSFMGCSEQNNAGCKQACDASIKLFATNEDIKKTMRRPRKLAEEKWEMSINPQMLEKTNVFIYIPDEKLDLYAPLVRVITSQFLSYMSGRPESKKAPILFCIDEFASFKIDMLGALRKFRKRHVRIMVLTQSIEDVSLNYGDKERNAMFANFDFKLCLGASTPEEQEWWAKLAGQKEVQRKSVSTNSNTTTETVSDAKEWAIAPAEWRKLDKHLVLVYKKDFIKLRKNYYYKYY